jgi:glyoxylate reductase
MDSIDSSIRPLLEGKVEILDYNEALARAKTEPVAGILCLPHPHVDGKLLDQLAPNGGIKVVSNYGVGVDHINLDDCIARKIPVGHTPHVLNK